MLSCGHSILFPPVQIQKPKLVTETEPREAKKIKQIFTNVNKLQSPINPYTILPQIQSCSDEGILKGTLQLHAYTIKSAIFQSNSHLQTNLLNLYIRCKMFDFACTLFETSNVLRTNPVCWNNIITMYCRDGLMEEALLMFLQLQESGLAPDQFTLSVLLGVIKERGELSVGTQFHSLSVKLGYEQEEFVSNSLINMYASFGRIDDSLCIFEGVLDTATVVTWNSMITRLTKNELYQDGLKLYKKMQIFEIAPTPITLSSVLKSCSALKTKSHGIQVHALVIIHGFLPNVILETALVDFYLNCGELQNGRMVFEQMENRNVFTWNSMIRGYSLFGSKDEALRLFQVMRRGEVVPENFTYNALLAGVTNEENSSFPKEFRSIHAGIIKVGLMTDKYIGTSLITMYSKNQCLTEARLAFEDTNSENIGVWSSMIYAAVKNREGIEALRLFDQMLELSIEPNPLTFSSLFMACSDHSALEEGKQIHCYSMKNISFLDTTARNSLITMYSNCGSLTDAWRIFHSLSNPNVASFNSMISALAQHGLPIEASNLSTRMEVIGLKPDDITLINLLSAFNHAGLIHEGLALFNSMETTYKIEPRYQHCACVVDMLARAGEIESAIRFMGQMQFEPSTSLWRVILGACGKYRSIAIGRRVAERLIELEPQEPTNFVLIANVYAGLGRWAEAERIRNLMEERAVKKEEAVSWIEIKRKIYNFGVEDKSHPQCEEIYVKLRELMKKITLAGYKPDVSFTLHDIEEEKREESLWYHAEKIAFAFGVISTSKEVKLRIMKNLRVCGDCHNAFKYFSLITKREIMLKDKYRFHHFSDGVCSCGGYW